MQVAPNQCILPLFQLVLLSVDNDRGDLLVHEEENGEEDGWDTCSQVDIPET